MIDSRFAYEFVYEKILEEIQNKDLSHDRNLLSEKEYCQKFDVSLTTVRRALERLADEGIVDKTKGKSSSISTQVRCIRCDRERYIGMLMVGFSEQKIQNYQTPRKYMYINMYAHRIYKSIFHELGSDYDLLIDTINGDELEEKFPSSILNKVDTIFLIGSIKRSQIEYLQSMNKCVVAYNFFDKDIEVCRVNNDERKKMCKLVDYFISQGHRRIACINGMTNLGESLERYLGYQEAMLLNDIYINPFYVKWSNMLPEDGYRMTKELLAITPRPECIVCVNDGVAMGACDAIADADLKVGEDIFVSGHDNDIEVCSKYKILTIDPMYEEVGKIIGNKLKRVAWIEDETIQPCKIIYNTMEDIIE